MGQFEGFTLPAPTAGLNLVDPIDNMEPNYALELVNILPTGSTARVRYGYDSLTTTGETSQINYLDGLNLADGTSQIIGAAGNKLWKFADGSSTNITGSTVPTDSNWNGSIFANRLYIANGVDTVQVYNGTGTFADSDFTGVTLANLINVSSYKERIYFIEKDTLKFWYGNLQATGASALSSYDLQYFMKCGGKLLFAGSWTNQIATATADMFFAVSSEGEILFYAGSSPAPGETFALVARYKIGKPLGYRAFIRVNNDVWIITEQGIVPISALFSLDPGLVLKSVGQKINPLIQQYAKLIGFSHLWHGAYWPQGDLVYVVIPTSGTTAKIEVCNITKNRTPWTTYELYSAGHGVSVAVVGSSPYFGSSTGTVYTGETGYNDDGESTSFNARLPFSYYGKRGTFKGFKDIRPLMRGKRGSTLGLGLDVDFKRANTVDPIAISAGTYTPWGSPWGSPWSTGVVYIFDRHAVKGQGHCAAIRIAGSVKDAPLEFFGFEVRFDAGGQV